MARARNIKPSFFKNEQLVELPMTTRLLFIGLWCLADREGRLEDRPKRIKMEIFPGDDVNVGKALDELQAVGFILRYEATGALFIQVLNFVKHQKPHHMEVASVIPPPPGVLNRYNHEPVRKEQRERILERDGRKCTKCGATDDLEIDHIEPVSKGGNSDDLNLRTLCADCNSAKGNRPALAENIAEKHRARVVDGGSNRSDSLNPDSVGKATTASAVGRPDGPPDCPHDSVIAMFHEILPECPRVTEWNDGRQKLLRARWREKSKPNGKSQGYATAEDGLAYWRRYFVWVSQSKFLTGKADPKPGRGPFTATLEWLLTPSKFARVLDGEFHR